MFYKLQINCSKRGDFEKATALIEAMPAEADIKIIFTDFFGNILYNVHRINGMLSESVNEIIFNQSVYSDSVYSESEPVGKSLIYRYLWLYFHPTIAEKYLNLLEVLKN